MHIKLEFIDDTSFSNKIEELSKNPETKHIISGIINDFGKDRKIKYVSNITMNNSFTNKYLSRVIFKWPKISDRYITKYVAYLKSIGYIDL